MTLVDTAAGGFIDEKRAREWRSIRSAPRDGTVIDVWLEVHASLRSMGMSDSFGVPDAWFEGGKWVHMYRGKPTELDADYITHWRPKPNEKD